MSGISPKLPLGRDSQDGYALNKTFKEVAAQNLKMLILTAPGERIMDPKFGVGLRNYLFYNATDEAFLNLRTMIVKQANRYMPYIQINFVKLQQEDSNGQLTTIEPSLDSNYVHVVVNYSIDSGLTSETLIINL
tara:strand:+ start:1043 stop:1444 length:402 start_codon:yes stop_codon:yes gene_type:complete